MGGGEGARERELNSKHKNKWKFLAKEYDGWVGGWWMDNYQEEKSRVVGILAKLN